MKWGEMDGEGSMLLLSPSSRLISARHLNSRLCAVVIIPSFPFYAPLLSNSSLGSGGDVEQEVEKMAEWDEATEEETIELYFQRSAAFMERN